ncbi:M14 family metallopeptidase [Fulvivirgaceae bacterium BMA10]|uniref:M14 family metallopeptidase n=1 Tax=Splendidivirga corallicola TaxID=3051826 RepID=A0ABT8KNP4_9BACT|nr:M14 family metallopeptidase [Fulvivirgaceae bacterium BMA10]
MKKLTLPFLCFLFLFFQLDAQVTLDYYLPANVTYNSSIPTPESILGYEVGEWHVNHDQLVKYMEVLAEASERIKLEVYAKTYEDRKLLLLTITSPRNHENLESIKSDHVKLTDPSASVTLDTENMPGVAWMGYSVHGNEPSGTNASLLVAYYLAAAQGPEIEKLLDETVVLMDPMINPDGNMRFSTWVNSRKSMNQVTDPNNMEQNEYWPRGRTNHYWFDLNRDWLPLQHPESKGRIEKFHEWKPNVLTDHHEMGTNSTFFFQPGVPSRNHPITPQRTFELTEEIGKYHGAALDSIGSFYYSKQGYDDFYYGKGSTYPDVNGAVGILFEQASSRGHAQESVNGILRFPFTIKNQFATSLSTLKATHNLRVQLLDHQRTFYSTAKKQASADPIKAIVFGAEKDRSRLYNLAEILKRHQIEIYELSQQLNVGNNRYEPNKSFIVPLDQKQYRLIKALFEKRTSFKDSLFYDVSAWTLPLAFNLNYTELNTKTYKPQYLGKKIENLVRQKGKLIGGTSDYAYVFEWFGYYTSRALNRLHEAGIRVKVATEPFQAANGQKFNYGTILVPVSTQDVSQEKVTEIIGKIVEEDEIDVWSLQTSGVQSGIYLGSGSFASLRKPKIMMVVDDGVSGYDAGEVWHLFDQRFNIKVSMLSASRFNRVNLSQYNTLILVDGNYSGISGKGREKLKTWIEQGGNVIAMQSAIQWLASNGFSDIKFKKTTPDSLHLRPYATRSKYNGAQVIGGAIFETRLDLTHPIAYGYEKDLLPIFRNTSTFMERKKGAYANPVMYTAAPLLSGYISDKNAKKLSNTAAVCVSALGAGRIISFTDDPNFRAFWYGTNKLFMNSIFFGSIISSGSTR